MRNYGIKFPFEEMNNDNYILDADNNQLNMIISQLNHLLNTKKGQKIRDPEFGLDLDKYLFEQNVEEVMDDIKRDIKETINNFFTGITVRNITPTIINENIRRINVDLLVSDGIENTNTTVIIE